MSWRDAGILLVGGLLLLGVCSAALALRTPGSSSPLDRELDSDRLYNPTNLWTVHLKFAPDQWEAMEPKGGSGPFGFGRGPGPFGGPGGPGREPVDRGGAPDRSGGPGGPDGGAGGPGSQPQGQARNPGPFGGPRGPGGFGPAMLLAPAFMTQGDLNHDGRLSRDEFLALARKWFAAWDTDKTGKLDTAKIRSGLNAALNQPGQGPRLFGLGNRGPGMMLQGPEGKRNGLASAMGIDFTYVHADLEFEGRSFKNVGVRYKGNGTFLQSRGSLKRSLKVDLGKYDKHLRLGGVRVLNFHNCVTDASWMNEVLSYRLYRDAGLPAPRTAYARVYVTVPGKFDRKYFGLYSLVENVDKIFMERTFGTRHGAIFKPVTPALFSDLGPNWSKYRQTYDPKIPLSQDQIQRTIEFCRLVSNADDLQFAGHVAEYVDIPQFARFMGIMVWLSDIDGILGPGQNLYLYLHPKSQLFEFIAWDQDHSFGQFPMRGSQEQREQLSIDHPWTGENKFLERMFKVDAFKKAYLASLNELGQTLFRPGRFSNQVDELAAALRPAIREESDAMLTRFDRVVAGESLSMGGFGPFGRGGSKPIKQFAPIRTRSVLEQLAGTSEGLTLGGFGFPGAGPGGGARGPQGPGGFGPGNFLADTFMRALSRAADSSVTEPEFIQAFDKWFDAWNTDQSGTLSEEQLRAGINKDLSPSPGRQPQGFGPPPGFGPPGASN